MEIKGDALRYMNLVYLDRENLRFKRKIDINLRALSRQWARSWITTVIEKNYYCNVTSATNDFAIDRQLLPDIKRTLSSDVFSRFDRVLSSNRGADDNSRNRYKDIEINSLSPLLIAMYCIDKSLYLTAEGGQGKTAMMRSVWLDYMSGRSIVPCVYVELGLLKKSDKEAIKSYIANEYRIPDLDKLSKDIVLLLDGANETIEEFRDVVDGEDGCRLVKECKALISANKKIVIGSRSDVIRGGETVGNKKEFDDKDEMIYMSVAPLRDKQIEHCLKNKFAAVKNKRPLIDLLRNNMMLHIYNRLGLYGIKIARKNMSSGKLLYMYFHVCFKTRYIRNTLHDEVGDLSDAQLYEVIREIEPPDEVGDLTDVQLYEEKREIEPRKKLSKRVEQRISDELERYNKIVVFLRDNCFGDIKELRDDILPEAFESLSIMSKVDGVYRWKHENFEEYFQAVKLNKMLDELKCGDSNKLCDNYLFNVWKHENFEEYFQATESDEMLDKLKCGYGNQLVDNYLSKFGYLCASPNKHKYNVLKFASDIKSFEEQFYYELYKMVYPKDAERLTGLVSVAELFLLLAVIATGNIPDGVKRIYSTFDSCEVIERVIIPDSVKSIDIELFKKCRNLKELELPRAMKFPPCHMLYGCDRLRDITFRARNGKITKRKKEEVFYDCVCKIIDNKAYKKIRSYKKDDSKAIAFENVCMDTIEAIMALSSEHTRQDSIKIAKEWVRFANKDYKQEHNEMYKYRVSIFDRVRREFIIATDAEYLLLQNQLYDRYDKKNR
ncbi:MAG: leucine-rich repeat domain-containing protein [Clostridiales bacterium]|nr:leucine-rich repeat domain-containing protein [Clostridiales bacterium]